MTHSGHFVRVPLFVLDCIFVNSRYSNFDFSSSLRNLEKSKFKREFFTKTNRIF